ALAGATGGDVTLAARLVSAGAAAIAIAATAAFARRALPASAGAASSAAAILATSGLFLHLGQQGVIDPTLTACTTIACAAFLAASDETGFPPGSGGPRADPEG